MRPCTRREITRSDKTLLIFDPVTKNELNTSEWRGARPLNQLRVAKEGGVIPQGAANPLPYNKKQKQQQTERKQTAGSEATKPKERGALPKKEKKRHC